MVPATAGRFYWHCLKDLWIYLQLWPTCLKIFGERLLDNNGSARREISKQRLMLCLVLVEAYVIDMLCCGNNKWKGEAPWFSIWQFCTGYEWPYDLIFSFPPRRRQLAQLGSATGVYKTLVKYLVGVPQVVFSWPPPPQKTKKKKKNWSTFLVRYAR